MFLNVGFASFFVDLVFVRGVLRDLDDDVYLVRDILTARYFMPKVHMIDGYIRLLITPHSLSIPYRSAFLLTFR